ncbi:MAG: RHS repeat-associated core domain-containing protein [Polyangiaceae bacterium]
MVVDTATGELVQELQYDAWGRVLVDTNPGFQPFGYAGGIYDAETGLVRFGARDYDAEIGRWTAKDPVRFEGGSNFYEYAASNPVDLTDPTGLDVGGLSPMQRERLERGLPPDGGDDGASSESADPSNSGPTVWDIPGVFPHPIFGFPVFIPGWMILGGLEGCDGDFSVRSAPTVIPGCEPNSTDRIAGCKEQIDSCNERTQHKKEKCCEDEGDKCKQCLTSANTAASGPCG